MSKNIFFFKEDFAIFIHLVTCHAGKNSILAGQQRMSPTPSYSLLMLWSCPPLTEILALPPKLPTNEITELPSSSPNEPPVALWVWI